MKIKNLKTEKRSRSKKEFNATNLFLSFILLWKFIKDWSANFQSIPTGCKCLHQQPPVLGSVCCLFSPLSLQRAPFPVPSRGSWPEPCPYRWLCPVLWIGLCSHSFLRLARFSTNIEGVVFWLSPLLERPQFLALVRAWTSVCQGQGLRFSWNLV